MCMRMRCNTYYKEAVATFQGTGVSITQPHAAYAAFTHGLELTSKWTYLARTIPDIEDLLQPLECVIRQRFLPSLTGRTAFSDADTQ